jgi:hypothetical protein
MTEFTYLFHGRQTPSSPEQMQKHMEKWVSWFQGTRREWLHQRSRSSA